ncbi:tetratricopeptide repeat protein [bacterium]|nr:tetratricopeptide repeat protein [bacterium]
MGWLLLLTICLGTEGEGLPRARELWLKGSYDEAVEELDKLDSKDSAVVSIRSACFEARGKYSEAQEILSGGLSQTPGEPNLIAAQARIARLQGRGEESLAALEKAKEDHPDHLGVRWEHVETLMEMGQDDSVLPLLEWFVDFYNDHQPTNAEDLVLVARGAAEYARRTRAADEFEFILNTLLTDARAADPVYWPTDALAGEILLEKYNKAEAIPLLQKGLATNPNAAELLVALGVSAMRDFDFPNGFNFAQQALDINPHSVPAHTLRADLLILDERIEEAKKEVDLALAVNPHSQEALGRQLACWVLSNQDKEAADLEASVLVRRAKPGIFYASAGSLLEQRRRFGPAEGILRKAVEAAPHLADPRNQLGMLLMRIGREDEARQVFAEAFEIDPFHVRVSNMRKVLTHLQNYQILKSAHYELKVSGDQDELLGPYMLEFLESIHPSLCQRFGYEPAGQTKIEIMKSHAWFSARVVGLPSIGTVGACTGDVVALASPQGLPQSYNWARVLAHEVTHVINLQQTKYAIPHWYTEALAVQSEGYPRPQVWNELLAKRVPKRDLLNLDTINHAFVRPKTPLDWQMAYCQAQQYAEYMQERFGPDSLSKLLTAYRDGMPTDVAIRAIFQVTKEDFEKGYIDYLDRLVAGLRVGPARVERSFAEAERAYQAEPKNAELVADLALHYLKRNKPKRARELADEAIQLVPDHPVACYVLAKMEWSIGKPAEAMVLLEPALAKNPSDELLLDLLAAIKIDQKDWDAAAKLYETAHEKDPLRQKWVEGLVKVYLKGSDKEKLAGYLQKLSQMDADNATARQKLAELAFEKKDWPAAVRWSREAMHITIKPAELHQILGQASRALKDWPTAIREYEVLTKLAPDSLAEGMQLVKVYIEAGEKEKAKGKLTDLKTKHPNDPDIAKLEAELVGP